MITFVPPSLSDLFYLQQGSEHDRDSAATLGQILESQSLISSFRTFTASETGNITLGDYNRNVIIVPSAKDQSITLDHFPSSGLIIYAPDWDAESAPTSAYMQLTNNVSQGYKGGALVFFYWPLESHFSESYWTKPSRSFFGTTRRAYCW